MEKKVSILIPAYNADRWIGETLRSAISQTWPNKEIIVVDDGSSDETFSMAKKYESGFLKVIRQDNCGASAARNLALSKSQGNYIQWLDADDLLAPDKIWLQIRELENGYGPMTLLSGPFATFHARVNKARFIHTSLWKDLYPIEWLINKFQDNVWMNPAVWLVSRELTDRAGHWDERLSLDDDGEYFSRVVSASEHVRFVPGAKAYYRYWNPGSLSRARSERAINSLFLSLTICIRHLLDLENSRRTRSACVRYLQNRSDYFYPDHRIMYEKIREIAAGLGEAIVVPRLKSRYAFLEKIIGYRAARRLIKTARRTKFFAAYHIDNLLYGL